MRVCIVTPRHLSANPRVVKEATALADEGHFVHIVHGHYSRMNASLDAMLANPSWQITSVTFGPQMASKWSYARQTLLRHSALHIARCKPLTASVAKFAIEAAAMDLLRAAVKIKADLYVAHYDAALPAVTEAARRYGAHYAFDAEDFHPGDLPHDVRHAVQNRIIDSVERGGLPGAAYVTAASPGIADAYAERYSIPRPTVVLNTFPKADAPPGPTAHGEAPGPSLYWFSQTRGVERGLECALEAIAIAKSRPRLTIRGAPQAGFDDAFIARAREHGCADRVELLPPEEPSQMVPLAARYDAGFVGETGTTENRRIALTNKQFTYLLAGVPAVMSDISAHARFAEETIGATFLYRNGSASDLARVLDDLFLHPDRLSHARAKAWHLGQTRYNWDIEQAAFLRVIGMITSKPKPGSEVGI